MEVKLQDQDGIEFCQELKSDRKFSGIPVIFLTDVIDSHTKVRAFEAGGVDYITKP